MNLDHAKQIPIAQILQQLNIQPRKTSPGKLLYLSPIRPEKTPSFWVYQKPNRWHDYGIGEGGDPVDLACAYLKFIKEDHTVSDGLRWLGSMMGGHFKFAPVYPDGPEQKEEPSLALRTVQPIKHTALFYYLQKRGIPQTLASHALKEVYVRNQRTGKSFYALGFANEEGGYELRNPFFKGSLGAKAISFIRGCQTAPHTIHIFEGMFDYLSAVTRSKDGLKGDAIILNSLSCLKQLQPYIHNYGYRIACTWLDNDPAGDKATGILAEFFKTQADLTHLPMNRVYAPHKDVNAWHMQTLNLTL